MLLISFASFVSAQKGHFGFDTITRGTEYSFPVFHSPADSIVEIKINVFLQLFELQLLADKDETNLFKELRITDDSIVFGATSLIFEVIENSDKILSVAVSKEWCGASCNHWTAYYNFNSGNGDMMSIYDFIEKDKINIAISVINGKRTFNFLNQLKNLNSEQAIDTTAVFNEIDNSNLDFFYFRNDSLFISDEECLSKFEKAYYDLNMITGFSTAELKPYLNEYGKTVLSISKKDISKFSGNKFPQLYKGKTNDSIEFYFTFDFYYDFNGSGFIAMEKERTIHSFDGRFENNNFDLTEHDNNYYDVGFIKAALVNGKIIGSYKSVNGKINYTFSATKM